jgi:hypothetical protein
LARLGAYFGETEIQRLQDAPNDTSKANCYENYYI